MPFRDNPYQRAPAHDEHERTHMNARTHARTDQWSTAHYGIGMLIFLLGFELLGFLVSNAPRWFGAAADIPIRGKHLDTLEPLDVGFIIFNRLSGVIFVYHLYLYYNALLTPNHHSICRNSPELLGSSARQLTW